MIDTAFHHIGVLDGPLLLFGGPYGNLEATQAVRTEARRLGIPPRQVICTGDIAAYCADPVATIALIREWGIHVVLGNCEEAFGYEEDDCNCGFDEGSSCEDLSQQWYRRTQAVLTEQERKWMRSLPRRIYFELRGINFVAVHGGVKEINRFIFSSTTASELAAEIEAARADVIVAGHCGLPFTRSVGEYVWHNSGAIGVPANDGTPDVWYSTVCPTAAASLRIRHHRLAYDYPTAMRRMREERLPEGYAAALESGLWPSLDVLPQTERAATGLSLHLSDFEVRPRREPIPASRLTAASDYGSSTC